MRSLIRDEYQHSTGFLSPLRTQGFPNPSPLVEYQVDIVLCYKDTPAYYLIQPLKNISLFPQLLSSRSGSANSKVYLSSSFNYLASNSTKGHLIFSLYFISSQDVFSLPYVNLRCTKDDPRILSCPLALEPTKAPLYSKTTSLTPGSCF